MTEVNKLLQIRFLRTSPYHPQTNGLTERFNKTLTTMLSMYVGAHQKDWDIYIPYVMLAYRSSVHASTADTPYFLMHGHDIQLPSMLSEFQQQQEWDSTEDYRHYLTNNMKQIWDEVLYYNSVIKQQQEVAAEKDRIPPNFHIGNLVWLYTQQKKKGLSLKLMHLWHGPYQIVELTSPVNVKLQTMNSKKMKQIVHVSRLRKYVTPMRPSEEPVLQESDDFDWEKEMEQLKDNQLQQTSKQPTSQHSSQMDDEMMESEKDGGRCAILGKMEGIFSQQRFLGTSRKLKL